ncbi:MAG: hypothetical protein AMK72_13395 [Planctomycetes bacterium SM23_25]|nr:MAG: hypothetical protein AMK72_13395 [Planctomycetes bacterium SM23_25]
MAAYYGTRSYQVLWRPVTIADAYRPSAPWGRRLEAEDRLDQRTFDHQMRAAGASLGRTAREAELKAHPQRAPLYTQFPAYPAARACIGLTALLEYQAHAVERLALLSDAVCQEAQRQRPPLDGPALAKTVGFVNEAVSMRLALDHLTRFETLLACESYRLFAGAMLDLRLPHLRDVIVSGVLLGDLVQPLAETRGHRLHPLTRRILLALAPACRQHEERLAEAVAADLPPMGRRLAERLFRALWPFLPLASQRKAPPQPAAKPPGADRRSVSLQERRVGLRVRRPEVPAEEALSLPLHGADELAPPAIDEGAHRHPVRDDDAQAQGRLAPPGQVSDKQRSAQALINRAEKSLARATATESWQDPRVDQVAAAARQALFRPGVVEGQILRRRWRVRAIGSGREGLIEEEVLLRCRDADALRRVRDGAAPIEKKLRGLRWFGQRRDVHLGRLLTRGALDRRRLCRLGISPLIRRRWTIGDMTDYRGCPVVVLAKDGSSSNTHATTFAGQILAAAFLRVAPLARIRVVAADYASGAGPLVRWLYHPRKTPVARLLEAADAVAALPPKGQGRNEDILSISYILTETVAALDAGDTVHVINVTDGKFNDDIGAIRSMVRDLHRRRGLTYSLVVLGGAPAELPEADHLVRVPESELGDPHCIAERIARHVHQLVIRRRGTR